MEALAAILREHPELAIFLTLGAGFSIGRIRIGSFTLGNIAGTTVTGAVTESTVICTAGDTITSCSSRNEMTY